MSRYEVQHRYASSSYGPFEKGTQIELDPAEAAWINHDSPGTLVEVDPEEQARAKREARERAAAKASGGGPAAPAGPPSRSGGKPAAKGGRRGS